jgi:hypothetical protein
MLGNAHAKVRGSPSHDLLARPSAAGLVILSVSINSSAPILGILDLSAGVTVLNWWDAATSHGGQAGFHTASDR